MDGLDGRYRREVDYIITFFAGRSCRRRFDWWKKRRFTLRKKIISSLGTSIPVRPSRVIYIHGGYYYYHHHRRRCRRHRCYATYVYRSEWLGIKQLTGPSHDDEAVRIGVFCTCVYVYIYIFFFPLRFIFFASTPLSSDTFVLLSTAHSRTRGWSAEY